MSTYWNRNLFSSYLTSCTEDNWSTIMDGHTRYGGYGDLKMLVIDINLSIVQASNIILSTTILVTAKLLIRILNKVVASTFSKMAYEYSRIGILIITYSKNHDLDTFIIQGKGGVRTVTQFGQYCSRFCISDF